MRRDARPRLGALADHVLITSYRGVHGQAGTPSQTGLQLDADAAIQYVTEQSAQLGIDRHLNVVARYEVGAAVAIHAAHAHLGKMAGLIAMDAFVDGGQVALPL